MNIRTTYRLGGPVGLAYALKLALIRWRLAQVSVFIEREKDLHRECLQQLNVETNRLVDAQQRTHVAAADYWRQIEQPAAASRGAR